MKTSLLKLQVGIWFLLLFVVFHATGQTTNQYGFSTVNTASLALDRYGNTVNMGSGTTQLIGSSQDDMASSVTNIGFTFRFMGTNYTQFSVNSNGGIRLGGSAISGNTIGTSFPVSGQAILAPYLQDIETHSSGKIHYRLVGTSPNRVLVIEFLQMRINFTSTTNNATFQARLYETSNIIEYVYGAMSVGSTNNGGGSNSDARNAVIGFSNTTGTNNQISVNQSTYATNVTSTPTTNSNSSTGNITGLNSSSDGSRRSFTFTPPTVTTGTITGSPFCAGDDITVPFTSVGNFTSNTYTAELSSSTGSFSSPTSIGTLVSNSNSGNISATLPSNAATGTGYRIRVTSSNSNVLVFDNGVNISINAAPTVSAGSSVCVGNTITISPTTGGTWLSNSPLVASVTNAGVVTGLTSGTSTFTFTNTTTGCSNTTGTVTVSTDATLTQTSASGTESQSLCISTPITNITYLVGGGGTGASVTGLPSGVTGNYNSGTKVYTISGSPTASGTFNFTVTTTGPCGNVSLGGTLIVSPNATLTLTSGTGSNNQTRCINNAFNDITYSIGGTGDNAGATGLPAGVTGDFNAGVFTISGTPTVSGTFTYTVTATGTCGNATATGTLIVNANSTLTQTSAAGTESQTRCISTSITNITYLVGGGGTGATVTGLPSGLNGNYNSGTKVYTISGSPSVSGTFNYTVTTTGPCINTSLSGTVTVVANATISLSSAPGTNTQTVCQNSAITDITYTIGGTGTGATASGLPAGVSGTYDAGVFTISGSPSATGTFNYTVTSTGPCGTPSLTGTITVNTLPSVSVTATPSTICIGQTATLNATNSGGNLNVQYSGSSSGSVNIPDGSNNSYTYSSVNLSAGTAVLASTDLVQVTLNISHNNLSDLDIFLVDPSGTRAILLTSDNGGTGNNYINTVFSTSASNVIGSPGNTSAPFTGTYRPEGTLSAAPDRTGATGGGNYNSVVPANALSGATINGNWTLRAFDDNFNFTAGTITSWSLSITQPGAYVSLFDGPATITPGTPSGSNTNPSATVTPPVGVNSYTVTTTDVNGCSSTSSPVTVTVEDNGTISLSSAELTDAQTVCINTAITDITYAVGGTATGANATGLPAGVNAVFNAGVLTISGTPTVSGTFNYTVQTTGSPCVNPSLNGSITVNADATIALSSTAGTDNQTVCINTPVVNITYAVGGSGTSATVFGLPAGLTANYSAGVLTISGSPTESGVFGYTVFTSGPCITPTIGGTVTVTADATLSLSSGSSNQSICIGNAIADISYQTGGTATAASATGLPGGVTAVFNAGVLTISGTPDAPGVYNYTVTTSGPCANPSLNGTIAVGAIPVVGQISGPTGACAYIGTNAQLASFTVATTDPSSSFTWNIPAGATNVSGLGTSTVSFKYPLGYNGGNIDVTVAGACGVPENRNISIGITPPVTPTISGIKNICDYVGTNNPLTYSVAPDPNARGFEWTIPPHVHVLSMSPDQTSINVRVEDDFGNSPNKQIRARALSACGNSNINIVYLTAQYATTPSPINGPTDVCSYLADNSEATYTIRKVNAASSYIWNFTDPNVTVVHPNGPGENDTIVTVTFGASFQTSQVTVRSVNDCGTSSARSLTINRTSPWTPGLITGPTNGCAYILPGGGTATYSIRKMATATAYTWTTPNDWVVTHQNTAGGINDTLITVQFPAGFTGGSMSVIASNGCGSSVVPRTMAVGRLNPASPGVIDVIQTSTCPNREYTYTIATMPANATSVVWTVPAAGTIVSGQGTNSITVSYPSTSVSGNVTVQSVNNCGNSVIRQTAVKLVACPAGFAGNNGGANMKGQSILTETGGTIQASVFPNPTAGAFSIRISSFDKNSRVMVRVLDVQGRELNRLTMMPDELQQFGTQLKAGTYLVEVTQAGQRTLQKVIKL